MGKNVPIPPDDELSGLLHDAVERVRGAPVSDQLIERCASRASEIPSLTGGRATNTEPARGATTRTSCSGKGLETAALAASLLIAVSLNALWLTLDRPDPNRQKAAQLTTTDKQTFSIYSDLRLEPFSAVAAAH